MTVTTVLMLFIPCSYEAKFEELDAKNQQFQEDFRQKSQDQHNAVTLYTKTLEQKGVCFINLLILKAVIIVIIDITCVHLIKVVNCDLNSRTQECVKDKIYKQSVTFENSLCATYN